MPTKQQYQNTIRNLMAQGNKAFNAENREAWALLIDNGMVRDSNGNKIKSQQIDALWDLAHKDALLMYDDPNVNPYVLTTLQNANLPENGKINFDFNRMSPDTFVEKVGVGMPKPKSPGIGSWINHAWERLFGRPGNTKVNEYYEKKAVYDKLAYDRKIAAGYKVEKPENVAKFELDQLSQLGTEKLDNVDPIDVSTPAEVMKNPKVQAFLHQAAVNRAYWIGRTQNGVAMGGQEMDDALDRANVEARRSVRRSNDPEAVKAEAAQNKDKLKGDLVERAVGKLERHLDPEFNKDFIRSYEDAMVKADNNHLATFFLSNAANSSNITRMNILHQQNKLDVNTFSLMVEKAYAHSQPDKDPDFSQIQNQLSDLLAGNEKNVGEYYGEAPVQPQNQNQKDANVLQ